MGQAFFNLSHDFDEVIYIQSSAGGTGNDGDATRPQAERFYNFPGDSNFLLGFRCQRNADRVTDAFVQQNAQTNRGLYCTGEGSAGFSHAEMEGIVDLLSKQSISSNSSMNVGCLQ